MYYILDRELSEDAGGLLPARAWFYEQSLGFIYPSGSLKERVPQSTVQQHSIVC